MLLALDASYGRWALQCLASEDFGNIPNALYSDIGTQLMGMFAWDTADATYCGKPLRVLFATGVGLRLVGCVALVASHRDEQHKPSLFAGKKGGGAKAKLKPRGLPTAAMV
ncbi:hypothetical protein T492DRAFT_850933 [Pavlovales sp. CCMP2436]|nr:hypothetical protein T492DRAFT_850933 [Pavlovales sp. CCMP2436]